MPLVSHSSMLRNVIQPAKKAMARTMATLSKDQRVLLNNRLERLRQHLNEENETIQRLAPNAERLSEFNVAAALGFVGSKNRRLVLEKEMFDINFKLAEDKKD